MKLQYCLITILLPLLSQAQITGKVVSQKGDPVSNATLSIQKRSTITTPNGSFIIHLSNADTLTVSHTGFITKKIFVSPFTAASLVITLEENILLLSDVIINTGYQSVTRQSTTGSVVQIDNTLVNRRVSTNILDRLEGITSGVVFNAGSVISGTRMSNELTGISIRGRSTLDENVNADPLIILDNFPYEGNIANINPNDVESVTVLKDAAAAAIWGARSGNGVIVITTKKGRNNQKMKVEFNSNITVGEKPNLFYSKNFLPSADYIDLETLLFNKGFFDNDVVSSGHPMLSPVVEILLKQKSGIITSSDAQTQLSALKSNDVRNNFIKYVYRKSVKQQYSVNIRGGNSSSSYSFTAGYDDNLENLIRDSYKRFTLNSQYVFTPLKSIDITASIIYSKSLTGSNTTQSSYGRVKVGAKYGDLFPYGRLADDQGIPLPVAKNYRAGYLDSLRNTGFLDWSYRPLDEISFSDNTNDLDNLVLRGAVKYRLSSSLNLEMQYQRQSQHSLNRNLEGLQTYSTRSAINQFYNPAANTAALKYPVPKGALLDLYNTFVASSNIRLQGNYNHTFNVHEINAIGGAEIREVTNSAYDRKSYGYDDATGTSVTNLNFSTSFPINPTGSATLSQLAGGISETVNRYVSYYANTDYTYKRRYSVSISGRKDGANIFGVKINDKITPLWSTGIGWDISNEGFYKSRLLPYLKFRASFGYNGNVYNAAAYLTAQYRTSALTGLPYATIISPPNPELRWERVRNINTGIDFRSKGERISGTFEVYRKEGLDLIEAAPLSPSTGFVSFKGNAAQTRTKGFDLSLTTFNTKSRLKWTTDILLSYASDKVIHVDKTYTSKILVGSSTVGTPDFAGLLPIEGKSVFGVYSYRWGGIDNNGNPLGYLNDTLSTDYLNILAKSSTENLVFHGSSRPLWFGGFRNTLSWKNISVSANITFKFAYYFRRSSISLNYQDNISSVYTNADYIKRWQKAGDETITSVPSPVYPSNTNRNDFYQGASVLIEKGDHIRFKDIAIQYSFNKSIQLYIYINNIGLLWRANKEGIDPDFNDNGVIRTIPDPRTYSAGCRINF